LLVIFKVEGGGEDRLKCDFGISMQNLTYCMSEKSCPS